MSSLHSSATTPPASAQVAPRGEGDAIEAHGLVHRYGSGEGAVTALRGLDLAVDVGAFTAVMGPSGSGKSTFLNLAAGLEAPTGGSIVVGGEDLTHLSETERTLFRRARLGIVFQGFHLIPYLTAEQNVSLPLRLAGRRVDRAAVRDLLTRIGLGDRVDHLPGQLSGGQQQRVSIARALIGDPALVLADEPTGALDSVAAREVLDLLRDAVDERTEARGGTVVMVTHDPVAAAYADTVVFLVDGRVAGRLGDPTADTVATRLAHLDQVTSTGQRGATP